jgi:hypothetical protein
VARASANIYKYYHSKASDMLLNDTREVEYSKFVTHQDFAPHIFWDNFSLDSATFKHALQGIAGLFDRFYYGEECFAGRA